MAPSYARQKIWFLSRMNLDKQVTRTPGSEAVSGLRQKIRGSLNETHGKTRVSLNTEKNSHKFWASILKEGNLQQILYDFFRQFFMKQIDLFFPGFITEDLGFVGCGHFVFRLSAF